MSNKINISIIVPIYNVERYIKRCLYSVSNQTMTSGIECILIDDCGNDNSIEIVQEFIKNYSGEIQFLIIKHDKNRGLSAARNTGIKAAKGKYLFFLDSDDEILPDTFEKFNKYLNKWNDIDCIVGDVYASYPYSQWIRVKKNSEFIYQDNKTIQKYMLKRNPIPVTAWNKLIKKDIIIQNNLFFQEGVIHEDELWSFILSRYLNSYGYINYATYVYFQNPHSIVTNRLKSIANKILILQLFLTSTNKNDIYERFRLILEWILDIYFNISFINKTQRDSINFDKLNQTSKKYLKMILKKGYFHMAVFLFPFIIKKKPGYFQCKYLAKLFSRILRAF